MNHCSIIMVTYRNAKPEREGIAQVSISSLLRTAGYPYEFILIDNTQVNQGLGWARNMGIARATGKYIAIVDDDIEFYPRWLVESIKILDTFIVNKISDKIIATPIHVPRENGWWKKHYMGKLGDYDWHTRSGSNCMVMTRESFDDIGLFLETGPRAHISKVGVEWHDRLNKKGYKVLLTQVPYAHDMAFKKHSYA